MKSISKATVPALLVIISVLLSSCKQPETVIVTESPTSSKSTEEQQDTSMTPARFRQLNIGETDRIPSLDPLFANNTGTLRALQLVFEGLVRYTGDESVVPAVAKKWEVSSDSLTYTFTLHNDIYYHDSQAFSTGIGRKLVARDVKYVFERMAQNNVPAHAARLFMEVKGFEPYYREQHDVLYPADRHLSGIGGIKTPNDTTVVFTLESKDTYFLHKLASPYAVVYPREAVHPTDVTAFRPVGTGPFTLSRKQGNSRYIFARYGNYHRQEKPALNRVDIITGADASVLTNALRQGNIHLIPELGPALMNTLLRNGDNLNSDFAGRFSLSYAPGRIFYTLNHNPQSATSRETARAVASRVDTTSFMAELPNAVIEFHRTVQSAPSGNLPAGEVRTTHTSDPFLTAFLDSLSDTLEKEGVSLTMLDIRTPVKSTDLYTTSFIPFYPSDSKPAAPGTLIRFSARQAALLAKDVQNLHFNNFPWWLDLRATTLSESDNPGQ